MTLYYPNVHQLIMDPESGVIQQTSGNRGLLRRRTIQRPQETMYGQRFAEWNRRHLAFISTTWRTALNTQFRGAWNLFARHNPRTTEPGDPKLLSGFQMFQLYNKEAGPCYGDPYDDTVSVGVLSRLTPPTAYAPPLPAPDIESLFRSRSDPQGLRAALRVFSPIGPNRWRAYAEHPHLLGHTAHTSPFVAVQTGTFIPTAGPQFDAQCVLWTQLRPSAYPNPAVIFTSMQMEFLGLDFNNANDRIRVNNSPSHPWVTLNAVTNCHNTAPDELAPDLGYFGGFFEFETILDRTIPDANEPLPHVPIDYSVTAPTIPNVRTWSHSSGSQSVGPCGPTPPNQANPFFAIERPVIQIADFTFGWLKIFRTMLPHRSIRVGLRIIDHATQTPGPLAIIIAQV